MAALGEPLQSAGVEDREPLRVQPKSRVKTFVIIGVAVVVVGAVIAIIVAASHKGKGLLCGIEQCNKTSVPSGAKDCSQATCDVCNTGRALGKDEKGLYCALDCAQSLSYCSKAKQTPRVAATCAEASCEECATNADWALDDQSLVPTGRCSFTCSLTQTNNGCAPGSCNGDGSCGKCVPGFTKSTEVIGSLRGAAPVSCSRAASNEPIVFYMYRAQSDTYYPPENVDLASPSGVMWYLHNEVVNTGCQCPPGVSPCVKQRHYGISLVLRFKVTVYNPIEVYNERKGQLGHFFTFDRGQCTNPDCEHWWTNYGYSVGCQPLIAGQHDNYPTGGWYSLPGRCPSLKFDDPKKAECGETQLGGHCDAPNGNHTCTWNAELLDNITVDEFCGITDYEAFCASNKVEYDKLSDKGTGCSFWDGKEDAARNRQRVLRLNQLFAAKTPGQHAYSVPDPVCDGF